ncbi:MAG: hypothetical protein ABI597_03735 [Gammaproteobacteria bacterium]
MQKKSTYSVSGWICYGVVFFFLSWILLNIFFGEHIPVDNGNGWDGSTYANITVDFYNFVFRHRLDQYTLQRILPAGIVYSVYKLVNLPIERSQIALAFSLYNFIVVTVSIVLWNQICKLSNWSNKAWLLGFSAIFLNFAQLKWMTYYPVLTDTTALFLSILTLYCFVLKKDYLILIVGIVASFAFPTQFFLNITLFLFTAANRKETAVRVYPRVSILLAVFCASCITGLLFVIYSRFGFQVTGGNYKMPVLLLSLMSVFTYLCYTLRPLMIQGFMSLTRLTIVRTVLVIIVSIAIRYIINLLSDGTSHLTLFQFSLYLTAEALAYPFNFLFSQILYFGPMLILAGLYWRQICAESLVKNTGLSILVAMGVVLLLDSEARQTINFLPFMVFVTVNMLNKKNISWKFVTVFVVMSLVISKAWLTINHGVWPELTPQLAKMPLEFPLQWFFMNVGPWVSHTMYIVHALVVAVSFIILLSLIKEKRVA